MALQSADGVLAAGGGPLPAAALDASADARASAQPPWIGTARELLTRPLPHAGFVDRCIQRGFSLWGIRQVRAIYGLENLRRAPRPCMVALNYSIKREALTVPALLDFHNDGKWIPFIGDWNFLMIPFIGWVMRRSQVIVVTRKSAKPAFLNRFKRYFEEPTTPAERVKARLAAGDCVGVFPEGTTNRNPRRLMVGRVGMSRLSLEAAVPVVPIGIRFPGADPDKPLGERAAMEIHIGRHLIPPAVDSDRPIPIGVARRWHATVMTEISRLSGKSWGPQSHVDDD